MDRRATCNSRRDKSRELPLETHTTAPAYGYLTSQLFSYMHILGYSIFSGWERTIWFLLFKANHWILQQRGLYWISYGGHPEYPLQRSHT